MQDCNSVFQLYIYDVENCIRTCTVRNWIYAWRVVGWMSEWLDWGAPFLCSIGSAGSSCSSWDMSVYCVENFTAPEVNSFKMLEIPLPCWAAVYTCIKLLSLSFKPKGESVVHSQVYSCGISTRCSTVHYNFTKISFGIVVCFSSFRHYVLFSIFGFGPCLSN